MKKVILIGFVLLAFFIAGCRCTGEGVAGKVVQEVTACTDTDGGNNAEEKGTVNNEFTDKCVAGLLIEYYCEDNKPANQNHRCPDKCVSGACV